MEIISSNISTTLWQFCHWRLPSSSWNIGWKFSITGSNPKKQNCMPSLLKFAI